MVAAWISADTGVGPAIASGSQTNSGNCADLPARCRASKSSTAIAVPWAMGTNRARPAEMSR
jgi:hypothetical protein